MKNKGQWLICIQGYFLENGNEIPKGRMEYSYGRFPVSGLWRRATEEEIESKNWHKGNYFNLSNI